MKALRSEGSDEIISHPIGGVMDDVYMGGYEDALARQAMMDWLSVIHPLGGRSLSADCL